MPKFPTIAIVLVFLALAAAIYFFGGRVGKTDEEKTASPTPAPPSSSDVRKTTPPKSSPPIPRAVLRAGESGPLELQILPPSENAPPSDSVPPVFAEFRSWMESASASVLSDPARVETGVRLATARRAALAELIASNPRAALQEALTPTEIARLPSAVQAQMERIVAAEGDYNVIAICNHGPDQPHGSSCQIQHEVILGMGTPGAEVFKASIYGSRLERLTEENASLYGVALDGKIALHEDDIVILPASRMTNEPVPDAALALIYKGRQVIVEDPAALEDAARRMLQEDARP